MSDKKTRTYRGCVTFARRGSEALGVGKYVKVDPLEKNKMSASPCSSCFPLFPRWRLDQPRIGAKKLLTEKVSHP